MRSTTISRRRFLQTTALGAAAVAAPYVKTAHSAGKLSLGLWDHWVPGANEVMRQIITDWGQKNNVDTQVDFITSIGNKNLLTAQAESRAKTGHDILSHPTWQVAVHQDSLEPVDEIIAQITEKYGDFVPAAAYLGQLDGTWRAVPATAGSQTYPMVSRLDLFKQHAGVDLQRIFPADASRDPAKLEDWNYDNFLTYAQKLHAAGKPFGNAISATTDSQDWLGPLFMSFGSTMVDQDGNIVVDSDATRAAIEYMQKLAGYMPPDVYAWDDAGNNRWIISGMGSSIQNPPSAWTVALRDNPDVGTQLWHHDTPRGPQGHFRGSLPYFWGLWSFSQNKPAAKDLLLHLSQKEQADKLIAASKGFDTPMLPAFYDNRTWATEGPPDGTIYNYPVRGDEVLIVAGSPAPPLVAAQIYNQGLIPTMLAQVTQGGKSVDDAIDWASNELEGYLRG